MEIGPTTIRVANQQYVRDTLYFDVGISGIPERFGIPIVPDKTESAPGWGEKRAPALGAVNITFGAISAHNAQSGRRVLVITSANICV